MRTSETVEDWLAAREGWTGDIYCGTCREKLLMDITPIGFDERTGQQRQQRNGRCPRAGILGQFLHETDGVIIPPRPMTRPVPLSSSREGGQR